MKRRDLAALVLLVAPLALATAGCGDEDDRRAALQDEELDRELDLALRGDTFSPTFEDTALGQRELEPQEPPVDAPRRQTPAPRQDQPRREQPRSEQPRQPAPQPEPEPEPQPRTERFTVPVGTTFAVRMNDALSTERSQPGDAFTARLMDPIVDASGVVIVPAGAVVRGRVTAVSPSSRVGQTAALKLAFEAISFGGESYPLQASVQRADVQQRTRTSAGETAGKVAAGAAAGAILGQVLGKDKESTLKGAAIGAAAGTAVAMGTADVDAVLPVGAEVIIRLDQPINVTRTAGE